MKIPLLSLVAALVAGQVAIAQVASHGVVLGGTVSVRDGFTRSSTSVLMTRNGVTQKVETEVALENGLRVKADGSVTLPNGEKATLRENQILTLVGAFEDVALLPQGTAPVSSVVMPMKKVGEEVGVSSIDGVTVSGGAALVTRNGATERLTQELTLANGTKVQPNGTVTLADGKQITLRINQVLSFDGQLLETRERVLPASPAPRDGGVLAPSANPTAPR